MFSPYLGAEYQEHDIFRATEKLQKDLLIRCPQNIYLETALSLTKGEIVGWFQGRGECGPRALGNRSILADPRRDNMKDLINSKVKFREEFRPFAPAVLWEHQSEYFDLDIPSPYMLYVANVKEEKKYIIPAVTHVDGTARIQSVIKDLSPHFYMLISAFYLLTDVPIVLNTSFNVRGEPIVETPEDAIRCFVKTGMDKLCIGRYVIEKRR